MLFVYSNDLGNRFAHLLISFPPNVVEGGNVLYPEIHVGDSALVVVVVSSVVDAAVVSFSDDIALQDVFRYCQFLA